MLLRILDFRRKYRLVLYILRQCVKSNTDPVVAELPFLFRAHVGIAERIWDGNGLDHFVDTHGLGDIQEVAQNDNGNTGTLDFFCHR